MPNCGSQIALCDVPIRYDTYQGCAHACAYCFTSRKTDIKKIKAGESPKALELWISGKRGNDTAWCDWDIPIHWGGMSDPFQPVEKVEKRSLRALEIFAESGYPFIVSTKNALIAEEPYFSLIKRCNCVVQFSAVNPVFDKIERGATPYAGRIEAARKIAEFKRVNIRIQPYIPALFLHILRTMKTYAEVGIHGVILEGMKYTTNKVAGLVPNGRDFVYTVDTLLPQFIAIKNAAHKAGIKFYCGENRLRALSDELCCCGIEGMGWRPNEANLNHFLFDTKGARYTERQRQIGTAGVFGAQHQDTVSIHRYQKMSYAEAMDENRRNPYQFVTSGYAMFKDVEAEKLRLFLRDALTRSGLKSKDVDKHLGTNGMAGHYFTASQWCFPTPEAYEKMREILPLPTSSELFALYGIRGRAPYVYGAIRKWNEEK